MTKNVLRRSGENVCEKSLSSKAVKFYLREINKLPAKLQDGIQNKGEYSTE